MRILATAGALAIAAVLASAPAAWADAGAGSVSGSVSGDDGRALHGEVRLYLDGHDLPTAYTTTNDDGSFLFDAVPDGNYRVGVSLRADERTAWGDVPKTIWALTSSGERMAMPEANVVNGSTVSGVAVVAPHLRTVSGHVGGERSGRTGPVEGATVCLMVDNASASSCVDTDGDGNFVIAGVYPGEYDLHASADDFAYLMDEPRLTVGATDIGGVAVVLHSGATLTGRIAVNGGGWPATLVPVILQDAGGHGILLGPEIDHDGAYVISHVPAGDWKLSFGLIPDGVSTKWVPQWWRGAASIDGAETITVANNQVVTGYDVTMTPKADTLPPVTLSVGSVAPGGSVHVSANVFSAGARSELWLHSTPVLLSAVTSDDRGAVSADVTIPPSTPPGTHRIVLVDADGQEFASADFVVTAAAAKAGGAILAETGVAPAASGGLGVLVVIVGCTMCAAVAVRRRAARTR